MYLGTASTEGCRQAMRDGLLGQLVTYKSGNRLVEGATFAIDNGVVKMIGGLPTTDPNWSAEKWMACLHRYVDVPGCLFVVVPDVVSDHWATLERWKDWAWIVRSLGYRTAFVLQDGATSETIPWDELDCLFIGGSTEFKMSAAARLIGVEARDRGKWVHMGRVNSPDRCRNAATWCDSVDGTYLAFGPDINLPKLLRFVAAANAYADHPTLFASETGENR